MDKARRSRGVRLATLLAACLTSASAFGLHPEPAAGRAAPASLEIGLPGSHVAGAAPHDCVACRAHRPLVSVPFLAFASAPKRSAARVFAFRPSLVPAFEPVSADGRAPPDLS